MGRVNCYGSVSTDSGRDIGIGGRGANDWISVILNTDNAKQSDCVLSVCAEVHGPGLRASERRRKDSDKRRTEFRLTMPDSPEGWSITVEYMRDGKAHSQGFTGEAFMRALEILERGI